VQNHDIVRTNHPNEESVSLYRPVRGPTIESTKNREITWLQLFGLMKRNRWLSISIMCVIMLVAFIGTLLTRPEFEATASVEIDAPSTDTFSLRNAPTFGPNDPDYLQTQGQILRSEGIAIEVIRNLRLDKNPDIVGPPNQRPSLFRRTMAQIRDVLGRRVPGRDANGVGWAGEVVLTPNESKALAVFEKNLAVSAVRESNLVNVSFFCPNPPLAARITNTLLDVYIEKNYRTRYETTIEETRWLSKQLDDLRDKVEKSNKALAEFQNSNGIVDLKGGGNTTTQTLEQLTQQLNTAKGDRIQLEAEVRSLDQAGVDAVSVARNNTLILDVSKMLAEASANLAQARAIYGENNANVQKYENQVNELQQRLNAERQRIAQSLRTSYASAVAREQLLTRSIDGMSGKIHQMNETEVRNSSLKKQVQVSEDLYNALFAKLKEAGISAGLRSSSIRIVDRALVPNQPIKPQLRLNLALALVIAFVFGLGVPVSRELLAGRLHDPEDFRKHTGLSPIGVIPQLQLGKMRGLLNGSSNRILTLARPEKDNGGARLNGHSGFSPAGVGAEAIRNLCTSIKLSRPQKPARVVLVTSAVPGEGKTTVATKIARILAESNTTCLIDADLRKPSVARMFGFKSQTGLTQVLSGSSPLEAVMRGSRGAKKLIMVPGGVPSSNPGELISSEKMRDLIRSLSEQFQNVVIDSPPILPFADARVMCGFVDGVLLVGRSGLTTGDDLRAALELLAEIRAPLLGIVLNGLDEASPYYKTYKAAYAYETES
jgi:polysaccharide biosynthesis transport protein